MGKQGIYTLSDPRDGTVRYVGRTTNIYQRFYGHYSKSGGGTLRKQKWIIELRRLGLSPIMEIIEEVNWPNNLKEREKYWIRTYLEQGAPLLNSLRGI